MNKGATRVIQCCGNPTYRGSRTPFITGRGPTCNDPFILLGLARESLNGTHVRGDQTIQMYGNFEGFPYNSNALLFGLVK